MLGDTGSTPRQKITPFFVLPSFPLSNPSTLSAITCFEHVSELLPFSGKLILRFTSSKISTQIRFNLSLSLSRSLIQSLTQLFTLQTGRIEAIDICTWVTRPLPVFGLSILLRNFRNLQFLQNNVVAVFSSPLRKENAGGDVYGYRQVVFCSRRIYCEIHWFLRFQRGKISFPKLGNWFKVISVKNFSKNCIYKIDLEVNRSVYLTDRGQFIFILCKYVFSPVA